MSFERLPEIFILCVIGLLVFGPKRVIEMGSTLGKAWREFRESTKDLSWSALLSGDEQPHTEQYAISSTPAAPPAVAAPVQPETATQIETATPSGAPPDVAVVEGTVEPQTPNETDAARQ